MLTDSDLSAIEARAKEPTELINEASNKGQHHLLVFEDSVVLDIPALVQAVRELRAKLDAYEDFYHELAPQYSGRTYSNHYPKETYWYCRCCWQTDKTSPHIQHKDSCIFNNAAKRLRERLAADALKGAECNE